jgi:hypothetical protein
MSETEQAKTAESKPKPKKANKVWIKTTFIRGYGKVLAGEKATKEQLDAWKELTDVKPKVKDGTDNLT